MATSTKKRRVEAGDAVSNSLDDATLAALRAVDRAEAAVNAIEEGATRARWALRALGEVAMPPLGMWCMVTTERFLAVGGPGWRVLGYAPDDLEGHAWKDFLVDEKSVEDSLNVVASNLRSGRGVAHFVNRYSVKTGDSSRRVVWRISPWHEGVTVAYGEVDDE